MLSSIFVFDDSSDSKPSDPEKKSNMLNNNKTKNNIYYNNKGRIQRKISGEDNKYIKRNENTNYQKQKSDSKNNNNGEYYIIKSDRSPHSINRKYNKSDDPSPRASYEIKDIKAENLKKNEYHIKYVTFNRQGYEFIHDRNYLSGLEVFKKCYELSKNYLNDEIKEINSLINISICQYYNGNFTESHKVISEAKALYNSNSLGINNISQKQKLHLTLKLFINSSLANLSINNKAECKNDIEFLISIIKQESDYNNQYLYYKSIIFILFKVESLVNFEEEENNIENSSEEVEINEPIKIINHLMKGFLNFLKEKNYDALLNIFKEAAQKYKRLNDYNGYYFSLFYHYLLLFYQKKKNHNSNELEEIKKKISACNNNLIGNEFVNQIKEKDINLLIKEFIEKINCACEIFKLLENYENEINIKINENNKEKDLSEEENNLLYSHLLDKSHIFTNEKINSPIFVKLLLRYSINFLERQKIKNQKMETNNQNLTIENYDILIKEINIMIKKISTNEINIDNIKLHQLDKEMINAFKQLFDNLIYIYFKSKLYKYFKKYHNKIIKEKDFQVTDIIVDFLFYNSKNLKKGLELFKINYKTKGYKIHFYNIDEKNLTFNIRKKNEEPHPSKSYSLKNDIIKVAYGIKSRNLRKKLLSDDKDTKTIELLRKPWLFISIITKSRSIDLYGNEKDINSLFYGFKYYLIDNKMAYKINSATYFLLNKIKLKLALNIRDNTKSKGKEKNNIVKQLIREKAIQNISFTKLFLLYNKYNK